MTDSERYVKMAEEFLNKMTEQQESHICEVVDNNKYLDSVKILSKEFNLPRRAFKKVYSEFSKSGKIRNKLKNKWNNAEIDSIKRMIESGHSILEIASSLRRHPWSIRKKVKEIYGCIPVIDIDGEDWRRVEESDFEVSNFGRFRKIGQRKLMSGSISDDGYISVQFNGVKARMHRLVAQAFVPNPEGKELVDHIDGNRANNYASNLRWVTAKENAHNEHKLKVLKKTVEKKRIEKEIDNYLKCIFDTGISKLDLMRKVLDYKEN